MTLQSKIIELFENLPYSTAIDNNHISLVCVSCDSNKFVCKDCFKSFLTTTLIPMIQEEERERINKEITKQFKYAAEHDNYDMRGVDWTKIIHPNTKE